MEAMTDTKPETIKNDGYDERISEKVITGVAEAKGVDPLDLDPLYDVIDPDALNSMFRPSDGSPSASMELRFSMSGCQVVIRREGEVTVNPPTENNEEAAVALDDE